MKIVEQYWGLRYKDTKILIAIDDGGYPHAVSLNHAKFWRDKKDAESYLRFFSKELELVKISISD